MSKTVKAGVVGAGVFGGYHAGKYAAHDQADYVGVYDPDPQRAAAQAEKNGGRVFHSLEGLIEVCDVITVASPASTHFDAARTALEFGRPVLVEKPVAGTVQEAQILVDLAESKGLVLQVGHQERFVFRAMGLFDVPEKPTHITARRMGPPSDRNLDVSVTLDLMVHDLDLVLALAGEAPIKVSGQTDDGRFGAPDVTEAVLEFEHGLTAELISSRIHHERDRKMSVVFPSGRLDVDFVAKTFENNTPFDLDPDFADNPIAKDSLGASVDSFLASVIEGAPVAAPGRAGLMALDAARAVDGARVFGS